MRLAPTVAWSSDVERHILPIGNSWRIVESLITNHLDMLVFSTHRQTRHFQWSADYLATAITKANKACDKRLARLSSYIHIATAYKQYYAGQNDYLPVFCFEGLFLNFVEITYRFPSLRAPFSSQVKMSETGFIPRVPFSSQVKILYLYIF